MTLFKKIPRARKHVSKTFSKTKDSQNLFKLFKNKTQVTTKKIFSETTQRGRKIISHSLKRYQGPQNTFLKLFQNKRQGAPKIFSNSFKNKTQGTPKKDLSKTSKIISHSLKKKTPRTPKNFKILSKTKDKGSQDLFKLFSKTNHKGSRRQILSKIKQ